MNYYIVSVIINKKEMYNSKKRRKYIGTLKNEKKKQVYKKRGKLIKNIKDIKLFNKFDNYVLTMNEMHKFINDVKLHDDYKNNKKYIYAQFEKEFEKKKNSEHRVLTINTYKKKRKFLAGNSKNISERKGRKEIRTIVTSLDVEKRRYLLRTVIIQNNWSVGLIINLANDYAIDGSLLKEKKKVKSLTILYLTSKSKTNVEKYFNTRSTVPCPDLRQYCGFLPIIFMIENIPTFEIAKQMFVYWKEGTRGSWSRLICGLCIYSHFKENYPICKDIKYEFVEMKAKETIKILSSLNKKQLDEF